MVVAFALLAAVVYGAGDFVGGFASRRRSAITVLLYAYPVGAALMLALLPAFSGPLDARTALLGIGGGVGGMVGVIVMYSLMARAPMNQLPAAPALHQAGD